MKKLLILIVGAILVTGCQNNNYHAVEYFENGKVKKEIKGNSNGVPNWSNKELNAIKIGM